MLFLYILLYYTAIQIFRSNMY